MNKRAIFTIVSCNYFHYAKTLMQSIRKVDPSSDLFVVLVDDGYNSEDYASKIFDVINFKHIPIPYREKMCFQYDILELNTAVKPFVIKYLFTRSYQKVVYLDPDIFVYNSLEKIFDSLRTSDLIITPHLTEPVTDKYRPSDLDILRSGIYNLGFLAVKATSEVQRFIDWWADKLVDHCRVAIAEGIFVDQKWCDFIPSFVKLVLVDHAPGMNVAYWNLNQRKIEKVNSTYTIGSSPLIFFHFSGLDLNGPSLLSRHEDRFESQGLPKVIKDLRNNYLEKLYQNGAQFYSSQPYHFDRFTDSSIRIPKAARELYRTNETVRSVFGSDPFDISADLGFLKTYNSRAYGESSPITLMCESIYNSRPDLQSHFPGPLANNGHDLCRWFVTTAPVEYDLDEIFVREIKKNLEDVSKTSRSLRGVGRTFVKKALTIAVQFARADRHVPDQGPSISKFSKHRSRLLRLVAGKTRVVAKRLLGYDMRHKILGALNRSLLNSYDNSGSYHDRTYRKVDSKNTGLNVIGYLNAESGVGESARSTIRAATAAGISISAVNFTDGCHSRMFEGSGVSCDESSRHFVNVAHVNADQTPALIRKMGPNFFSDRYNIGYWVWETTEFPSKFLKSFECYDEIWTASEFCRDALARKSPKAVIKMPHSVDINLGPSINRSELGLPEDAFMFLTMADFLSVPERKNPLGAIDSFIKAFGSEPDDVHLVVKISNSHCNRDIKKTIVERVQDNSSITIIDGYMDRSSLNSLIASADCYVSLHRSEGFGLPIAEAMSIGKPVIATGWSGNMEFMNDDNSFPVKYELTEIPLKNGPYKDAGCWAEPDSDHASEMMLKVSQNPGAAKKIGFLAKQKMAAQYSPEAIGSRIKDRLTWIKESID